MLRAELEWQGQPGMAGEITSALTGWNRLRFEATEEAGQGCDAMRFSYTPALGVFSAVTMANGDILVPENRLRAAMTVAAAPAGVALLAHGAAENRDAPSALEEELSRLLGEPWDCELEPFRCAADGAPVRWLNATG
jgi:Protein of unknown function (DUF3145)